MKILDIYKKYQIMPQLAEHQLRVAAVAQMICQSFEGDIDRGDIVAAGLLHDMGNIAKFTFNVDTAYMTGFSDPKIWVTWEKVKREFIDKYGPGSHNMTMKIVIEIGVSQRVRNLVDCVGFDQGIDNAASSDFGKKICAYSDMRVMPLGVASLAERMVDLRARYKNHAEGVTHREEFEDALRKIERQIFEHCKIKPEDITEAAIADRKEKLKSFEF